MAGPICNLADDCVTQIFSNLGPIDFIRARQVCHKWHEIGYESQLCATILQKQFSYSLPIQKAVEVLQKELYTLGNVRGHLTAKRFEGHSIKQSFKPIPPLKFVRGEMLRSWEKMSFIIKPQIYVFNLSRYEKYIWKRLSGECSHIQFKKGCCATSKRSIRLVNLDVFPNSLPVIARCPKPLEDTICLASFSGEDIRIKLYNMVIQRLVADYKIPSQKGIQTLAFKGNSEKFSLLVLEAPSVFFKIKWTREQLKGVTDADIRRVKKR